MRSLFNILTVGLLACLFGCVRRFPVMDLREPIYLVPHESLFANCADDSLAEAACREYVLGQIQAGADEWARFFESENHPLFLLVDSKDQVPGTATNLPVEIKAEAGACGETADDTIEACYLVGSYFANPEVVLTSIAYLRPSLVAHELGHVLMGPTHYSFVSESSIMSDGSLVEHVQAADIDRVCTFHPECPARKNSEDVWRNEDVELDY